MNNSKTIIVGALIALTLSPALADPVAQAGNALALTQIADCITTDRVMHQPYSFERDPLARPVAHSLTLMLVEGAALNLIARHAFHHHPKWMYGLAVLETANSINNQQQSEDITNYQSGGLRK